MQTLQWHRDTDTNQTLLPLCSRRWNNKWLHSLYLHLLWFIIYKASFSSRAQRHIFCICHSSEGQMRAYSFSVIHELHIQVLVLNIWRILCVLSEQQLFAQWMCDVSVYLGLVLWADHVISSESWSPQRHTSAAGDPEWKTLQSG